MFEKFKSYLFSKRTLVIISGAIFEVFREPIMHFVSIFNK